MKKTLFKALSVLRAFLFLLPAVVGLLLYWILPHYPAFTEAVFSRGIFRLISVPLGMVSSLFPFSLTEIAAVAALPALVFLLIRFLRRMKKAESRARLMAKAGKAVGWTLSSALLLYMLLHGLNFNRLPASELMELDTSAKSPEFLQAVCIDLAQNASAIRKELPQDDNGNVMLDGSITDVLWRAGQGYEALEEQYPFLWGVVNRGKRVHLSPLWSYTGITGMYFPFFAEANVNTDQPACDIPVTAAHELAHTRGFAREDECNFYACLACFHHPSADYRYSGYLMAYIYCSNALYAYDQELWLATRAYCSQGMQADLLQRNEYWEKHEGRVQEISESINNSFIEIQGDDDGVLSYDRVVELLLAYYEKEALV
ncbi:MAG TPA: DUF3810 domain-containing protein [Firmicutes bacterium]|nr:DUF3810 domain-containing protein [Bacillota bacterium]